MDLSARFFGRLGFGGGTFLVEGDDDILHFSERTGNLKHLICLAVDGNKDLVVMKITNLLLRVQPCYKSTSLRTMMHTDYASYIQKSLLLYV